MARRVDSRRTSRPTAGSCSSRRRASAAANRSPFSCAATDGAPAVRLGEGRALALSPDGKWALSRRGGRTILLPTGAGEPRARRRRAVWTSRRARRSLRTGAWLLTGSSPGHASRVYLATPAGGEARPVTPDGVLLPEGAHTVSADGRFLAASDLQGTWAIYPLDGAAQGPVLPIAGLSPGDRPLRWTGDGRLLVLGKGGSPRPAGARLGPPGDDPDAPSPIRRIRDTRRRDGRARIGGRGLASLPDRGTSLVGKAATPRRRRGVRRQCAAASRRARRSAVRRR